MKTPQMRLSLLFLAGCGGMGDPIGFSTENSTTSGTSTTLTETGLTQQQTVNASEAAVKFSGTAVGQGFGIAVALAPDLNGDGLDDAIVGVPGDVDSVIEGTPKSAGGVWVFTAGGDYLFEGENTESAGWAVAGLGDINGDGEGDFAVGAPFANGAGAQNGMVYLKYGPVDSGGSLADSDAMIQGDVLYGLAGWAIAGGRDIDGDGVNDFAVGAKWHSVGMLSYAGGVHLVLGAPTGVSSFADADHTMVGEATEDIAGASVDFADDIDGDGLAEVLVGALWNSPDKKREHAGAAYIVTAETLNTAGDLDLATAHAKLLGEVGYDLAGLSLASAGDVNTDGFGDILVSAPAYSASDTLEQSGRSYLVLGPIEGTHELSEAAAVFSGDQELEWAGYDVTSLNGGDALAIGSIYRTVGDGYIDGSVSIFSGSSRGQLSLSDAQFTWEGESPEGTFGWSLSGGGDINGDGNEDLIIGAPSAANTDFEPVGAAYVLYGPLL